MNTEEVVRNMNLKPFLLLFAFVFALINAKSVPETTTIEAVTDDGYVEDNISFFLLNQNKQLATKFGTKEDEKGNN